jgi:ribonuclease HI
MMQEDQSDSYTLFFDGCSKGNPGKAGAGAVIYRNQIEIYSQSSFVGNKITNNVAEYSGLILGLEKALALNINRLHVKGDSMLAIKQLRGEFKVSSPSIAPFYHTAKRIEKQIGCVTYEHIYREYNKRADQLANDGLLIN